MQNNSVDVDVLNDLIKINNDRVKGYEKALSEVKVEDTDLKVLFAKMLRQSQELKSDLGMEVQALGHDMPTDTTTAGKIYRGWMDIKAIFTGNDRHAVLSNCEFGEDAAQNAYKMALETDGLSANISSLITTQKGELKISHNEIRAMRDAAKA
ncbi:PA2169 family four-helix-bundle protein [Taibaiella lutea]|uniref:PA2169 family four-helix-bundle protein n=1 Tax=Taibaiella lutea TaxID=2608001 RepID=A0A5M6CB08_9BACT|nr:PA2169 family four-helix-bundle protein [Taibaiella lutea]KAA5532173.1 PA2169 family four-helix-bundle protein [Taibaiella lutea]